MKKVSTPMPRNAAMSTARAVVRELDRVSLERSRCLLTRLPPALSLPRALTGSLVQALSNALEHGTAPPAFDPRSEAFRAREILRELPSRFREAKLAPCDVVFAPRTDAHLRDMLPVADALAGHRLGWTVFRAEHAKRLTAHGHHAYAVHAHALRSALIQAGMRRDVRAVVAAASQSSAALASHAATIAHHLQENVANAVQITAALRAYFAVTRPKLVVVGNASLMEGRIAARLAHEVGARTLTIQHGDILEGREHFDDLEVDDYCVWGERSQSMLARSGVDPEHVHATGAAWLEARGATRGAKTHTRSVLVAFSGAGHMVGQVEHARAVDGAFRAAEEMRDTTFIFRVHPKDDPEPYRRRASQFGDGRVSVVAAKDGGISMQEQLSAVDVLVTVMSTSAIDAMLARVPVVTLTRPEGEHIPDYVLEGATTQTDAGESLVATLSRLLARGEPASTRDRATQFAERFYGPLDGNAATRIAEVARTAIRASS